MIGQVDETVGKEQRVVVRIVGWLCGEQVIVLIRWHRREELHVVEVGG